MMDRYYPNKERCQHKDSKNMIIFLVFLFIIFVAIGSYMIGFNEGRLDTLEKFYSPQASLEKELRNL